MAGRRWQTGIRMTWARRQASVRWQEMAADQHRDDRDGPAAARWCRVGTRRRGLDQAHGVKGRPILGGIADCRNYRRVRRIVPRMDVCQYRSLDRPAHPAAQNRDRPGRIPRVDVQNKTACSFSREQGQILAYFWLQFHECESGIWK
jgi:hypothetical protein